MWGSSKTQDKVGIDNNDNVEESNEAEGVKGEEAWMLRSLTMKPSNDGI